MKKIMLLFCGFFFITNVFAEDIKSTEKGGNWNDPNTWIGGKIPDKSSDVLLRGNVIVSESNCCKNLKVEENAEIKLVSIKNEIKLEIKEICYFKGNWEVGEKCTLTAKEVKNSSTKFQNIGTIIIGE